MTATAPGVEAPGTAVPPAPAAARRVGPEARAAEAEPTWYGRGRLSLRELSALALFSSIAVACSLSTAVLEVPANGAETALIAIEDSSGQIELTAFSFAGATHRYVSVPLGIGARTIYALRYPCSLDALELAPGALELAPPMETGRPLPDTTDIVRAEIRDGRAGPLEMIERPPELLLRTNLSACVSFEPRRFEVPDTANAPVSAVLPLDGDRALIATTAGRVWELSFEGLVELTQLSTTTPILGGFRAGDGEIFVAGDRGRTMRARPGERFVRAPSTTSTISFLRAGLSGNPEGPLTELFLVDGVKSFERFDGERWTRIDDGAPPLDYDRGSVAWIAPQVALAAGLNVGPIAKYDRGELTAIAVPLREGELIRSLRRLERYGVVIATSEGNILQLESDSKWNALHSQSGGIRLIAPLDRGLLFGGTGGSFQQLHPGFGLCEAERLAERDSSFVAELEHGFAFATDHQIGAPSSVAIVRRASEPVPQSCPQR